MQSSGGSALPSIREQVARDLVKHAYLVGDFVLSSGRRSRYYFDKYLFETKPQILGPVAQLIAREIPAGVNRIAGPELGAVALAAATSLETGIPFLIVKKASKDYATRKLVEGEYQSGEKVVVVEDVMTTGAQAIASAERLRSLGLEVLFILCIVDREEGAREKVKEAGFEMRALFTRAELEKYLS